MRFQVDGGLWSLRLNKGPRVRQRGEAGNRLVEFELATADWATARRLGQVYEDL